MQNYIFPTKKEMAQAAAQKAADILEEAIKHKGFATFVAATGASQFDFLEALVKVKNVDWSKTTMFHLDEYIGLPKGHQASFRLYLEQRLLKYVKPKDVFFINGNAADIQAEIKRINQLISSYEIDVSFVGIGENGHLAFNDPPADFEIEDPFIIVNLNEACRRQQLGEGWFDILEEIPTLAISMSIQQIMRSKAIICVAPDRRKQQGVYQTLKGEINPMNPASIMRKHDQAFLYLDAESAVLVADSE
jgi:glucosamine-6-phosphate deaminase